MKIRILLYVLLIFVSGLQSPLLSAWGRLGHAAVAQVAENHLSKKARKVLDKYLEGQSIVAIASDADTYRGQWTMDMGFLPSNPDEARVPWLKTFDFSTPGNIAPYSHMITVDSSFKSFKTDNLEGEYINNIAYYVDRLASALKDDAAGMDPYERFKAIALIVHFIGDMHCPAHIVYRPDNALKGKFKVWWSGEQQSLHGIWDKGLFNACGLWSFCDVTLLADTCDKREISDIVKGNVYDYAGDSAAACWSVVSSCAPGDTLPQSYATDMRPLLFSQIRNAGYRLASVLNEIFN